MKQKEGNDTNQNTTNPDQPTSQKITDGENYQDEERINECIQRQMDRNSPEKSTSTNDIPPNRQENTQCMNENKMQ